MSTKKTATTQGTQQQSGSQNQQQNFTNQYGFEQMPDSEDIKALRGYKEQIDPSIAHSYSRRQTNLKNSFNNPLGQYTTPAMRDATQRSHEGELEQEYGQAQRQGYSDMQGRTGQRLAGLAGLTAPTMVQTGGSSSGSGTYSGTGSSTGSTTQSEPLLPSLLGGAASVGAAALALTGLVVLPAIITEFLR